VITLQTGSDIQGDITGVGDGNVACFQGRGCYSNHFVQFWSLFVQADERGWALAGTNTFSTAAEIQSGMLYVNGILDTPLLTVDQGGTLGGSGSVTGSVTTEVGGTIAPGTA